MKKTAAALFTLLVSALLLSACAEDGWWGHRHDYNRHDDHFSRLQVQPGGAAGSVVASR